MITKTKKDVKIPISDWEKMRKNPTFSETVELLEDIADLKLAKSVRGKDITLHHYIKKRGIRNSN